jgi:hypothetical protein
MTDSGEKQLTSEELAEFANGLEWEKCKKNTYITAVVASVTLPDFQLTKPIVRLSFRS